MLPGHPGPGSSYLPIISWKSWLHVVYPIPTPDAFPVNIPITPAVEPWIMVLLSSAGGEGEGFYYHTLSGSFG